MNTLPNTPPPLAIALESMTTGQELRFSGIDLESGRTVTISIGHPGKPVSDQAENVSAHGLVLTLFIGRFSDPH